MSVSIGERVQVSFESARDGGGKATTRIGGRVAFTSGDFGQRGDVWLAEVEGENAKKTVYFLRLIRLVAAGDGLDEFLVGLSSYEIPRLREANAVVQATLGSCVPGSLGLAAGLEHAVSNRLLPSSFRKKYLRQALVIVENTFGVDDQRLILYVSALAYASFDARSTDQVDAMVLFERLLKLIEQYPSNTTTPHKVSALAVLGSLYLKLKRFADAEVVYREAVKLSRDNYVRDRLAVCLYEQGRYKEACDLWKEFPDLYFSAEEGEYNNRSRFNVEGEDFFLVDGSERSYC